MRCLLAAGLVLVLAGCSSGPSRLRTERQSARKALPEWWSEAPREQRGRFYCVGVSGLSADREEGLRQAEADARSQIAQTVSTQIVSETRSELSRMKHDGRPEYRDVFFAASRSLSDEALRGFRREAYHARAESNGKCQVRVLMSVPVSEVRPTAERRREQLVELATAKMKRGDRVGAANCWRVLSLLAPRNAEYALSAAACLEDVGLWQDAVDVLERFKRRNPEHAAAAKVDAEIERLRQRITEDLGKVQWAETAGRIRALFAGHAGGKLKLATNHQIYPMFDRAGERSEIILTVRTDRVAYLNLIWLDEEGIYMMDDYARGRVPVRRWDDKLRLRTGTKAGDVTIFGIASDERLAIPVREVLKAGVDGREPEALTRLRALEQALRRAVAERELPTDHVDIKVMP